MKKEVIKARNAIVEHINAGEELSNLPEETDTPSTAVIESDPATSNRREPKPEHAIILVSKQNEVISAFRESLTRVEEASEKRLMVIQSLPDLVLGLVEQWTIMDDTVYEGREHTLPNDGEQNDDRKKNSNAKFRPKSKSLPTKAASRPTKSTGGTKESKDVSGSKDSRHESQQKPKKALDFENDPALKSRDSSSRSEEIPPRIPPDRVDTMRGSHPSRSTMRSSISSPPPQPSKTSPNPGAPLGGFEFHDPEQIFGKCVHEFDAESGERTYSWTRKPSNKKADIVDPPTRKKPEIIDPPSSSRRQATSSKKSSSSRNSPRVSTRDTQTEKIPPVRRTQTEYPVKATTHKVNYSSSDSDGPRIIPIRADPDRSSRTKERHPSPTPRTAPPFPSMEPSSNRPLFGESNHYMNTSQRSSRDKARYTQENYQDHPNQSC